MPETLSPPTPIVRHVISQFGSRVPVMMFVTGDPGAGKSAFCEGFIEHYRSDPERDLTFEYLSTGDALRRGGYDLASLARGAFGPDPVVHGEVLRLFGRIAPQSRAEAEGMRRRAIVDGFPRKALQAKQITELTYLLLWSAEQWHKDWNDTRLAPPFGRGWWTYDAMPVVVLRIDPQVALLRYAEAGYAMSPVSGKFGPIGTTCPAGGVYADDFHEAYLRRREMQQRDLDEAVALAKRLGLKVFELNVEAFDE